MSPSVFFIPCALIFWGWQMQTLWIAVIFAGIIAVSEWTQSKFDLSVSDFNKVIDVCTIILAATIILALTIEAEKAIWILLKWLPVVLFPIIAAQKFSTARKINVESFFLTVRRAAKKSTRTFKFSQQVDVSYIYALLCLLSSGINQSRDNQFFIATFLFTIWGLWHIRSKRVSVWIWSGLVVMILVFGYAGQKLVLMTSMKINDWAIAHYAGIYTSNPFKSYTALGEMGQLKLSNKIVLRARYENYKQGNTYLLQNGIYNRFANSYWFSKSEFEPIAMTDNKTVWQINPQTEPSLIMTLYLKPNRKRSVLSLPRGTMKISNLKADKCQKNKMGVVRVEDIAPLIIADVSYADPVDLGMAPVATDLLIPKKEADTIFFIVDTLSLTGKSSSVIISLVKTYFSMQYTYSLELKGKGKHDTPVQNFLLTTRSGHCELFATATVLILRASGIPARYVTGFIVHEYSRLEDRLVVRGRDSHAWVTAFINGRWQIIDTTPAGFLETDNQEAPASLMADGLSYLGFILSQIRHETGKDFINRYGLWLILPLAVILFFRVRKTSQIKRVKQPSKQRATKKEQKLNESFYLLETYLAQKVMPRYPYETYSAWLKRIEPRLQGNDIYNELNILLKTHNQIRFGKSKVTDKEKKQYYLTIKKFIHINQEIK